MSGDVQPRKRKDKKRKKDDTVEQLSSPPNVSPLPNSPPVDDVNIHVHKEGGTGGGICAKIVFFILFSALIVLIGLIITEHRGLTDLDTADTESKYSQLFEGWVDNSKNDHVHHISERDIDQLENEIEENDSHGASEEVEQHEISGEQDDSGINSEEHANQDSDQETNDESQEEQSNEPEEDTKETSDELNEEEQKDEASDQEDEEDQSTNKSEENELSNEEDKREDSEEPDSNEDQKSEPDDDGSEEKPGTESNEQNEDVLSEEDRKETDESKETDSKETGDNDEVPSEDEAVEGEEPKVSENLEGNTDNLGLIFKLGIGVAILVVAHIVLVKKWKNDDFKPASDFEEASPDLSRRNTLIAPPSLQDIEQDLEYDEEEYSEDEDDLVDEEVKDKRSNSKTKYEEIRSSYSRSLSPEGDARKYSDKDLEHEIYDQDDDEIEDIDDEEVEEEEEEEDDDEGEDVNEEEDDDEEEEFENEELDDNDYELMKKLEAKYGKIDNLRKDKSPSLDPEESTDSEKLSEDNEYEFANITNKEDWAIRDELDEGQQAVADD